MRDWNLNIVAMHILRQLCISFGSKRVTEFEDVGVGSEPASMKTNLLVRLLLSLQLATGARGSFLPHTFVCIRNASTAVTLDSYMCKLCKYWT